MAQTKDPEDLAQELMTEMNEMIQKAETLVQQTEDFYKDLGAERGLAQNFLKSGKVPAADKEKIEQELAKWEEEVERDVKDAQERFKLESKQAKSAGTKKPRKFV